MDKEHDVILMNKKFSAMEWNNAVVQSDMMSLKNYLTYSNFLIIIFRNANCLTLFNFSVDFNLIKKKQIRITLHVKNQSTSSEHLKLIISAWIVTECSSVLLLMHFSVQM